ncbi:MAG: sensor histidine kinase [Faecousia sp.]
MEQNKANAELLAHFVSPAFYAENGIVTIANQASQTLLITPGTKIADLIVAGREEYEEFRSGCLYLTMQIQDQLYSAAVTAEDGAHLFITQNIANDSSLQAYSLAAKELRSPLAGIMLATQRLFGKLPENGDPQMQQQAAYINQNLYRMLRIVSNMSDAGRFANSLDVHMEHANVSAVLQELLEKIQCTCAESGMTFRFTCPEEPIYGPIDREKLERGVYNLVSNALKFAEKPSCAEVSVSQKANRLYITVKGNGKGIPAAIRNTMYQRYRRSPGIEDANQGIGLGMVLAKSAASIHGGALLMEVSPGQGAKITMTISLSPKELGLRSPVMRIDYTGEHNHCLVELSDCLECGQYAPEKLK